MEKQEKPVRARVVALHFRDIETAVEQATLEVEHENGDKQLFVIQVLRMTDRITPDEQKESRWL